MCCATIHTELVCATACTLPRPHSISNARCGRLVAPAAGACRAAGHIQHDCPLWRGSVCHRDGQFRLPKGEGKGRQGGGFAARPSSLRTVHWRLQRVASNPGVKLGEYRRGGSNCDAQQRASLRAARRPNRDGSDGCNTGTEPVSALPAAPRLLMWHLLVACWLTCPRGFPPCNRHLTRWCLLWWQSCRSREGSGCCGLTQVRVQPAAAGLPPRAAGDATQHTRVMRARDAALVEPKAASRT